jgi:1-acyl-sn-glycerol-3-phosphate acyltransferase
MSGWIAADTLDRDGLVPRAEREIVSESVTVPAVVPVPAAVMPRGETALPRRSAWRVKLFTRYFRRWMARNFHAVRLTVAGRPPQLEGQPILVVLNHPSWWDPLLGVVLADLFKGYRHYVPIDAQALAQYRIFEPLGFFGVEVGTPEGAMAFLKTGKAILSRPHHALWVTAQGKFTDPRERPVRLRQGVGHLVRRLDNLVVLPLAIEYPFWQERFPEALAHFGTPLVIGRGRDRPVEAWMARIEAGLTQAQDDLARAALTQDPGQFETLVQGTVGVGGMYDLWRRLQAVVRGRRFHAAHAGLTVEAGEAS